LYFSRNSLKRAATIKAQVFQDSNYNGIFDQHEQALPNVEFKGHSLWRNRRTNELGIVYLPESQVFSKQYIELATNSLDDHFLAVDMPSLLVESHAGGISSINFHFMKRLSLKVRLCCEVVTNRT